jgi:cell division inhibitor SepF
MAGFFKKALDRLGLEDDNYQDYDPYEDQPPVVRRVPAQAAAYEPEPAPSLVYPRSSNSGQVVTSIGNGISNVGGSGDSGVASVSAQPRASTSPAVRTVTATRAVRVHELEAHNFSEAQDIGERFRTGQPVMLDLRLAERDVAKRLVDFCSGLAFGLTGEIKKVGDRMFLLRPNGVELPADEVKRLREKGLMQ